MECGYKDQNATKINGMVPQYIKWDGEDEFLPVVSLNKTFASCYNLTEIPTLPSTVTSMYATFYGCSSLMYIPEDLFVNCTNITELSDTFSFCRGLLSIPENLFANTPEVTDLSYTFSYCTSLTSIPENLFVNCTKVESFQYLFSGCTALKGNAPDLWNRDNVSFHSRCFRNCTGLDNYDDIPEDWK